MAGVLEAAVRHLGDDRDVGVDPDAAEIQALGYAHGPGVIARPHRRREPVAHGIGAPQRVRFVGHLLHRDDGAEDLLAGDLVTLVDVRDERRLEEPAGR